MPKKYPPLTPRQVRDILKRWRFEHTGSEGSHEQWEHDGIKGKPRHVTVDASIDVFDDDLIESMINQSGLTREQFYGSTKAGSKKLNIPWRKPRAAR